MRGVPGSTPGHGTSARYKAGCLCGPCRAAAYRDEVKYEMDVLAGVARRVPGAGTARRLQALATIGWDSHALARQMGHTHQWVSLLRRRDDRPVLVSTAQKVDAVYRALCMQPGTSVQARRLATREGWAPPLAWDDIDTDERPHSSTTTDPTLIDDAAVERTLAGDRVPLTRPERVELIRRLASRGLSDTDMGAVVGITGRSVKRIRDEFGIESRWAA